MKIEKLIAHAWAIRSAAQAAAFLRDARFASIEPVCPLLCCCDAWIKHASQQVFSGPQFIK